jgi:hypothetical protein
MLYYLYSQIQLNPQIENLELMISHIQMKGLIYITLVYTISAAKPVQNLRTKSDT